MAYIRLKKTGFVVGLLAVLLGIALIYLVASSLGHIRIGHLDEDVAEVQTTVVPTETAEATATEESTEAPTEVLRPTEAPTEAPTIEPTTAPTEEPTEAPTETPAPQPEVQTTWHVVEADSDQPLNQVLVKVRFNQHDPTLEFWSNQAGDIEVVFDQAPSLGQNDLGFATFWAHGTDLELTGIWFRLDPSSRSLILLDQNAGDLRGPVRLYPHEQAEPPEDWEDSPVWSECEDVECATEIAATSPYFRSNEAVTCREATLSADYGTWQWYRAANGMSVVAPTAQDPNFVGPRWPDGGEVAGWWCGADAEKEEIFVVSGCGNIAIAVPRE